MKKLDFENFKLLPESMKSSELEIYFIDFVNEVNQQDTNLIKATDALIQLSERQWHTYENLNPEIKKSLEEWIVRSWSTDSLDLVENIISITALLGLSVVFNFMKISYESIKELDVKKSVQEAIKELDGSIEDPYSGMK